MKKTLALAAALLFAGQFVNAQTEKGKQNLGLGLNLNKYQIKTSGNSAPYSSTSTQNTFDIGPKYGYFISNGSEIGGSISYTAGNTETTDINSGVSRTTKNKGHGFGASVFYRKYVLYNNIVGLRFSPYFGYLRSTSTFTENPVTTFSYNPNSTTNSYNGGASVDLVYYPSKRIGIAATLGGLTYSYSKTTGGPQQNISTESLGLRLADAGLSLSVYYVLGKN